MIELNKLIKQFDQITYSLSKEDIFKFDKDDNGPINNIISRINKECYGVRLFDDEHGIMVEMFHITNEQQLNGDLIQLDIDDPNYFQLLMKFTGMLSDKHDFVDAITAFNTFQNKLRGFLEKSGFFTTTSLELKPYKGKSVAMFASSNRGIKNVVLIDRVDFYRDFFNGIYALDIEKNSEYIYLMVSNDTGYIKIGTSKNPKYRERTLHSQEPNIGIVALWKCDKKVEKELHEKFKEKRIRGEWFNLKIRDLKDLEKYMEIYTRN